MSDEQRKETTYQLYLASEQVTKGLGMAPGGVVSGEDAEHLVCALKEMLHTAETLTSEQA